MSIIITGVRICAFCLYIYHMVRFTWINDRESNIHEQLYHGLWAIIMIIVGVS